MGDRVDLVILGRKLGTYDRWDEVGDLTFYFYSFTPGDEVGIKEKGTISISFETGVYEIDDAEGVVKERGDIIKVCNELVVEGGKEG